jgi:hypothetical protein
MSLGTAGSPLGSFESFSETSFDVRTISPLGAAYGITGTTSATNLFAADAVAGTSTQITLQNGVGGATIGSSVANFQGILYSADYSADFVARSLVDKGYVDNAITA